MYSVLYIYYVYRLLFMIFFLCCVYFSTANTCYMSHSERIKWHRTITTGARKLHRNVCNVNDWRQRRLKDKTGMVIATCWGLFLLSSRVDSRGRLNTQPIWELCLHAEHSSLSTSLCASHSKVSELMWCAFEKIELELAALFRTLGVQLKLSTSLLKKSPSSYRVDSHWQVVGSHQKV